MLELPTNIKLQKIMKHIFDIKTLLLSLVLGTGALLTSCNDDDDDVTKADALFRPIVGETTVGGQWIELEWDRYEGAKTFVLTLAGKAAGQADSTKMEVTTDTTFYRFEGLDYDTDYLIKRLRASRNIRLCANTALALIVTAFIVLVTLTIIDYVNSINATATFYNESSIHEE